KNYLRLQMVFVPTARRLGTKLTGRDAYLARGARRSPLQFVRPQNDSALLARLASWPTNKPRTLRRSGTMRGPCPGWKHQARPGVREVSWDGGGRAGVLAQPFATGHYFGHAPTPTGEIMIAALYVEA